MARKFKLTAFAAATAFMCVGAFAAPDEAPAVSAKPAVTLPVAPLIEGSAAAVLAEMPPLPAETKTGAEKPADKSSNRFIERAGTGSSKAVRTAAPVTLPAGPLGKAPEDINKLLVEAQKAGGEPIDSIQKEMNLPGLKKDDPALKPFVLHTRNGVNEIVRMSGRLLNRVATPFKKPALIDTSESTSKVVGSDVYYMPAGDKPIGLYIVDSANTTQTISLTIIPASDLPGQNLIVKLEDLRAVENLAVATTQEEEEVIKPRANDYSGYVRSLMTQAVHGTVTGFAAVPLEGGVARVGSLDVKPELAFAGSAVDIYRYKLRNSSDATVDLVETAFYRKGVKAVSFFPHISLRQGEQGYVFLLADKPKSAASTVTEAQ